MKGLKADGTPIRVMAVDDSPVIRKLIRKALEPEGFAVVGEAGNGKEAVALFQALRPDVITMDITMPVMDGLEAATAIKQANPAQPIIMLSAMGDAELVADARRRGITHFSTKPFKPQEMVENVLAVLGS
ncbi:MAG: response regulator [Syntrophomonadaceae bacterium]|nr:response regulator [Syntrophomonadaceae bacterium]